METEISFVANEAFARSRKPLAADPDAGLPPDYVPTFEPTVRARIRDSYLASLYQTRLLSPQEEEELFREMNRLKYLAERRRRSLDLARPRARLVAEIETLLMRAVRVRDAIVRANLRLVVSIARKMVEPAITLDDLVSEGNLTLMRAVEKFDFSRGFRFSTYATHAIRRNLWRMLQNRQRQHKRERCGELEELVTVAAPDDAPAVSADRLLPRLRGMLEQLLDRLDDREQLILRARFGFGTLEERQTLQVVAARIGLSKERVRQLEGRAIAKLRSYAEEQHLGASEAFEFGLAQG